MVLRGLVDFFRIAAVCFGLFLRGGHVRLFLVVASVAKTTDGYRSSIRR